LGHGIWVTVYPNPTPTPDGNFGIVFSKKIEQNISASVYDWIGKLVFQHSVPESPDNQILVDTSEKNRKIFFIKIATNGWGFTKTLTLAR
jgi:hypothetical protein